ncbi:uncharacterized protein LOC143112455 isoform X1 [Alosa pseudoharengus]|uniref:uncharacterized protein LOC143100655 isoform X3 n=1 Tax=Alosa pseudoharengus TaxID=34774 RepID=UPI003F88B1E2
MFSLGPHMTVTFILTLSTPYFNHLNLCFRKLGNLSGCLDSPGTINVPSHIMTKISEGSSRARNSYFLKMNIFQKYVVGAMLENSNHWTLFYAGIERRIVVYMNSLGESKAKEQDILNNWSSFAAARGCDGPWEIVNVQHPMQTDGHSCGVHVILYAQALLHGGAVEQGIVKDFGWEMSEIRAQLCHDLFRSLDRTQKCSDCRRIMRSETKVKCDGCAAYRHARCATKVCPICAYCKGKKGKPASSGTAAATKKENKNDNFQLSYRGRGHGLGGWVCREPGPQCQFS